MSTLKLIQKANMKPTTETLTITNITEREKKHIISLLDNHFNFTVEDKNDYILKIENIQKADVQKVIDIINSV